MSFRLYVYLCAICGGGGAILGWALGRLITTEDELLRAGLKAMLLGGCVAFPLAMADNPERMSLRTLGPALPRGGLAGLIGALGGFLGGVLSETLYAGTNLLGFGLGWAVTGLLIGAAPGALEWIRAGLLRQEGRGAKRKLLNGVLGGAVGGFLGGLLSLAVRGIWTQLFADKPAEILWTPSAFGFVALGVSVGLLTGLAQVVLRQAWIRVESGFRPGREILLSRPELTVGRAEGCDLGLYGDPQVERLHARLLRQGNAYVLTDEGTPGGTFVNEEPVQGRRVLRSGDAIRVGNSLLRFGERTAQGSPPSEKG